MWLVGRVSESTFPDRWSSLKMSASDRYWRPTSRLSPVLDFQCWYYFIGRCPITQEYFPSVAVVDIQQIWDVKWLEVVRTPADQLSDRCTQKTSTRKGWCYKRSSNRPIENQRTVCCWETRGCDGSLTCHRTLFERTSKKHNVAAWKGCLIWRVCLLSINSRTGCHDRDTALKLLWWGALLVGEVLWCPLCPKVRTRRWLVRPCWCR